MTLDIFQELYQSADLYHSAELERMEKNMRQYLGSPEIDGSTEPAATVRNITFEIVESEVSSNIPIPRVEPFSYSERHDRCSKAIEQLCNAVRNKLPFEAMNDSDERYTYIMGGSVWYVEWDSEISGGGGVRIHCLSPESFIPQPGVSDINDMEYCFLRFTTTKAELVRRWGVKGSDLSLADCEYEYDSDASLTDTVRLIVAFYRSESGGIGKFVFSGDLVLADIPEYYMRKGDFCPVCGLEAGKCNCNKGYLRGNIAMEYVSFGEQEAFTVPYYTPKRFPIVIRKNTLDPTALYGCSDCERIRPQQQAINKIESRILAKLLRAGVTPVMPEDASVSITNSVFDRVIKLRPGESADSYGKIDTTPDVMQDIAEADRLYDQAKRIIGISDALQGTDTTNVESGYARQLKILQASSRLESKKRLKNLCYSEIYRLVFEQYLAFADEDRPLKYKDSLGKLHKSCFRRHDFIEWDKNGMPYYCDEYLFSVDLSGEGEYQREALWARNLESLEAGTLGDKTDPSTLLRYWQSQARAHYPYAGENAEHFKEILRKQQNQKESE